MKLKKIASLMLAGVMAVSMLAGCQTPMSSSTTTPVDPPVRQHLYRISDALNDQLISKQADLLALNLIASWLLCWTASLRMMRTLRSAITLVMVQIARLC